MKPWFVLIIIFTALLGLILLARQPLPKTSFTNQSTSPISTNKKPALTTIHPDTLSDKGLKEAFETSSLAGTDVDRTSLNLINGELPLKPEIIFYFEYFLNLRGEKDLATIKKMALTDFHLHYGKAIADQLYDLFLRYIAYRKALAQAFEEQDLSAIAIEHRMLTLEQQVQPDFFSTREIDALFEAQKKIFNKKTQAQKQQQSVLAYQKHIQDFPDEMEAAATHYFGAEAAQRLQKLKQEEDLWHSRLANYRLQYDAINSNPGLDDYGKNEAINLLQQRLFNKTEQLRLQALQRNQLLP